MGRLTDKYTLITGGTSGIGLATAQAFIAEGARVAVTGRNPDTLAEAERILGDKAWVIPTDAGDIASQKALAETLAARWPRLDAVFLNAGDVTHAPLEAWQEDAWDRLMDINLKGVWLAARAAFPHMRDSGGGAIVNAGSTASLAGYPNCPAYTTAKGVSQRIHAVLPALAAHHIVYTHHRKSFIKHIHLSHDASPPPPLPASPGSDPVDAASAFSPPPAQTPPPLEPPVGAHLTTLPHRPYDEISSKNVPGRSIRSAPLHPNDS